MQVLTFFSLVGSSIFLRTCIVTIVVRGNVLGDKSDVARGWSPQNSRFAKRGPRSSSFSKIGSAKQRVRKEGVREVAGSQTKKAGNL